VRFEKKEEEIWCIVCPCLLQQDVPWLKNV
jgi:hypothetical protein